VIQLYQCIVNTVAQTGYLFGRAMLHYQRRLVWSFRPRQIDLATAAAAPVAAPAAARTVLSWGEGCEGSIGYWGCLSCQKQSIKVQRKDVRVRI